MLHFTGVTLTKAGGFNFVHLPSGGLVIGLRVSTAHNRLQVLIGLNVREGSWLCENAKTLNRDRRSYSSKTVLIAQRASGFNLEIELKNIILRRVSIFEFYTAKVTS